MFRFIISFLLLFTTLTAKDLHLQWDKTYGADKEDKAYSVVGTKDGGIAVAGTTRSFSLGKEDVYILKTNAEGKLLWEKRTGNERKDIAYAIDENIKGDLYVAGVSKSYSKEGDYDLYILKLSSDGETLWGKSLGGSGKDYGYGLCTTKDGGVVIAGKTKSFGHGHYDAYVVKLSEKGKVLWSKAYGGTTNEEAHDVTELADGSLIIVGGTESFGAGDFDFYIIKLAPDGSKIWEKYYGEEKADFFYCVTANHDGGFTAAGYTRSYHSNKKDLTVMRCDKKGNILWHKIIGKQNHEIAHDITSTQDDGVIVAGETKSMGHGKQDFYILAFDKTGKLTFAKTYGGKKNDVAYAVSKTKNNGYVVAGKSESFGNDTEYDIYLMKLQQLQ